MDVVLLGTGSPLPDPNRAGPATLVEGGGRRVLVDAGRAVLMRAAAAGVAAGMLDAVLLTHLHSDHLTDLSDVITTRWVTGMVPAPLTIVGPPGTRAVVDGILASLRPDISYRIAHHEDIDSGPDPVVVEVDEGPCLSLDGMEITAAPTDHRPVAPTVAFRIEADGTSVVVAGDTVPCPGLDGLARGAGALVHTVIRRDLVELAPVQRFRDILDYHSSVEQAAETAARAGVATLVLTHYVPPLAPGDEEAWRARAVTAFDGRVELGDDLHRVTVG